MERLTAAADHIPAVAQPPPRNGLSQPPAVRHATPRDYTAMEHDCPAPCAPTPGSGPWGPWMTAMAISMINEVLKMASQLRESERMGFLEDIKMLVEELCGSVCFRDTEGRVQLRGEKNALTGAGEIKVEQAGCLLDQFSAHLARL
ncbi:UNVERIFIED_CONTAM: hypothetical protein K2H54_054378 [Gekko kuhli]